MLWVYAFYPGAARRRNLSGIKQGGAAATETNGIHPKGDQGRDPARLRSATRLQRGCRLVKSGGIRDLRQYEPLWEQFAPEIKATIRKILAGYLIRRF